MGWQGPWGEVKIVAAFWKKVEMIPFHTCYEWTGSLNKHGYGRFWLGRVNHYVYAHRFSYELFHGRIPAGLEIDHLCRNHACVNPNHLEAVTHLVNMLRGSNAIKTCCPNGHPYDRVDSKGARCCGRCKSAYDRRRYKRQKAGTWKRTRLQWPNVVSW